MNLNDKEKKIIKSTIEEITGVKLKHHAISKDTDKRQSNAKIIIKDSTGKELAQVKT